MNSADKYKAVKAEITAIYHENKGRYGYRRITAELHKRNFLLNHKTVQRLMKELGLVCRVRMKKYRSYKGEVGKIAPNLLSRDFRAEKPNQKWVTDVTEFSLFGEKLYLSPILDLHSSDLVSYTISDRPVLSMVTTMLNEAFAKIPDGTNLILHSGVLTMEENRSHFTMWCMLAAPLLAGNDIRKMDKETLGILTNKEVIAVNQDKLGKQGGRYMKVGEHEIWVKQLSNGEAAVCFFNRDEQPWNVETVLQKENLSFADVRFWEKEYKVRDLWKHKDIGSTKDKMQFDIPAHGVVLLKLTPKQ